MKNVLLAILTTGILVSCNTVKKTTATVNSGNYDRAIEISLDKLRKNPEKKSKQEYILLLEEAFSKAQERDESRISFLKKENTATGLEELYETYVAMQRRQDRIRPILPLRVYNTGRQAIFDFKNYDSAIISTKNDLATYLYENASSGLTTARSKEDYRNVYNDLNYLNDLKPSYRDIKNLMETAHFNGTDYVDVRLNNDSQIALPARLEEELLDFSTYGLNDFWTVYHSTPVNTISYDYAMDVAFTEINISPERIKEREVQKERQVKDGTKFLKDKNGNFIYDDEGEKIEVDNMITVRCDYYEFSQNKAVNVVGRVRYSDARTNQVIESFPLASEFIFDHRYATYNGDKRALEDDLFDLTRNRRVAFPTNEQMIYDAGTDLKNRIKDIIVRNDF